MKDQRNLIIIFLFASLIIVACYNSWEASICFVASAVLFGLKLFLEKREASQFELLSKKVANLEDTVKTIQITRAIR